MRNTACLICLLLTAAAVSAQDQGIRVGVVEFEEKNSIGVQNAGRIVAELVMTEILNTGRYDVQERLLMQRVLEEQELMLSGVIDETQAGRIGRLYSVDAIVTGSLMTIGSRISLTGRLINVTTGSVLKSSSVSFEGVDQLERECRVLANQLADIPREAFEVREDLAKRAWQRMEVGGGVGYGSNNAGSGSPELNVLLRYTPPYLTAWVEGAPLSGIQDIQLGAAVHPIPVVGLGAQYGMVFDNAIDYVEVQQLLFGLLARPRLNIEFGLMVGGALGGTVWTDDSGEVDGIDAFWKFPANFAVWLIYRIDDRIAVRLKYLGAQLGDLEGQLPVGYSYPDTDMEYVSGKFTVAVIYSFVVGR